MTVCSNCNKSTNNTYAIQCTNCANWYHAKCVGLTTTNLNSYQKELQNPKGKRWSCTTCGKSEIKDGPPKVPKREEISLQDVMAKLIKMEEKYDKVLDIYNEQIQINQKLQVEINKLKEQIQELALKMGNEHNPLEAVREIDDREGRKMNLMIFGCPESSEENGLSDTQEVNEIIQTLCPEDNITCKKVIRIGKPNTTKARPLRITLNSSKEVRSLFFKAKELKKNTKFSDYALGFDKTRREIEEYKALRQQMQERITSGEENLRIKYFRDVPKIIKIASISKN